MNPAKLPNNISEDDYSDTSKYILLEQIENKKYSLRINKTETGILIEANQVENPNMICS